MKNDTVKFRSLPKFIYAGMVAAAFVYIILLKYAGLYGAADMNMPDSTINVIYNVFLVFSVLIAAVARPFMSRIYQMNMIKKELLIEHGLSESDYKGFVRSQLSLMMASFYELIALFGFLLGILGADWKKIYSLIALGILLLIIRFPRDPAVTGEYRG